MSLHYILDGYNIIHQVPTLSQGKLEEQRNALVRFLEEKRPQGSVNNELTVVFDGRADIFGQMQSPSLRVIFSQDTSADDKIKEMVEDAGHKKSIVVVTGDRDIQYAVRALGAKVLSVEEFLVKAVVRRSVHGKKTPAKENKYIPKTVEFQITEEFESIWLKPKDHKKS